MNPVATPASAVHDASAAWPPAAVFPDDLGSSSAIEMEVRGLTLSRRNVTLFRNLSLDLRRGTLTAVLGPSGSGKSSLLAVLAGLLAPDAGRVVRRGTSRTHAALVPQDFALAGNESVLTNVLCGALGRHAWWRTVSTLPIEERRAAVEALDRVGIAALGESRAGTTSGGQQQRVAVARALLQRPAVLLADEPVSQLDQETARSVLAVLREVADRGESAVVCVLHDEAEASAAADAILRLDASLPDGWRFEPRLRN